MLKKLWDDQKFFIIGFVLGIANGMYTAYRTSQKVDSVSKATSTAFTALFFAYSNYVAVGIGIIVLGIGALMKSDMGMHVGKGLLGFGGSSILFVNLGGLIFKSKDASTQTEKEE
tara:strand:+ start:334 stop:678 length:345 start_codon:yes stop_codon:yes gene_type:complete